MLHYTLLHWEILNPGLAPVVVNKDDKRLCRLNVVN